MNAGDEFVVDCILAESSIEELWQIRAAARDEIKRRMAQPLITATPPARRRQQPQLVDLDPTQGAPKWIN